MLLRRHIGNLRLLNKKIQYGILGKEITIRKLSLLMLACGCLCLLAATSYAEGYSPRLGQVHPDFTLPSVVDHKPVSLSQFRGQKVLLIHFASW
jgi:hypothetical protein